MINIYTESDLPIHSETDLHVHQYKQTRVPYIWIFHHIFFHITVGDFYHR